MWNNCLRSRCDGLIGGGLETYFVSVHGNKLGIKEGSVGGILVGIEVGETGVAVMVQEDVM